jgi:hypothetical protein
MPSWRNTYLVKHRDNFTLPYHNTILSIFVYQLNVSLVQHFYGCDIDQLASHQVVTIVAVIESQDSLCRIYSEQIDAGQFSFQCPILILIQQNGPLFHCYWVGWGM